MHSPLKTVKFRTTLDLNASNDIKTLSESLVNAYCVEGIALHYNLAESQVSATNRK